MNISSFNQFEIKDPRIRFMEITRIGVCQDGYRVNVIHGRPCARTCFGGKGGRERKREDTRYSIAEPARTASLSLTSKQ